MKKYIFIFVLITVATSLGFAGGIDLEIGAGLHSSFQSDSLSDLRFMMGIAGFVGVGYGFDSKQMFNLGLELNANAIGSFIPLGSQVAIQTRAYGRWKQSDGILKLTVFGGYQWARHNVRAVQDDPESEVLSHTGNPLAGLRLSLPKVIMYLEYTAVFPAVSHGITRHEITIGISEGLED